jgi:hypothetical protein
MSPSEAQWSACRGCSDWGDMSTAQSSCVEGGMSKTAKVKVFKSFIQALFDVSNSTHMVSEEGSSNVTTRYG